jgi:AcrR family transcriptional regulator
MNSEMRSRTRPLCVSTSADAAFDVREEALAECLERGARRLLPLGGANDVFLEDLAGGLDGRQLELLLRAEMSVEAALRDTDVVG